MRVDITRVRISPTASVREAMKRISDDLLGVALVLDSEDRLSATITDGDIRRALLGEIDLDAPVTQVLKFRAGPRSSPIVAPLGSTHAELLELMRSFGIRHVPLVDPGGGVRDLAVLDEMVQEMTLPVSAVIMAGGEGSRLRPLTVDLPKPLLPLNDRTLIERTLEGLQAAGITRVSVTTHYQREKIMALLGDGQRLGLEIDYVQEEQPLGTAGALRSLRPSSGPQLVVNGDIVTTLDFRRMVAYHREQQAEMTVGTRRFDLAVPYGVVETEGTEIVQLNEKPTIHLLISAGIYLLEPTVHASIPAGDRYDMTDLIRSLVREGRRVVSFPIHEYWLDIGRVSDYERAMEDVKRGVA